MLEDVHNNDQPVSARRRSVYMIGAFPPPLHGMAAVNAAVRARLGRTSVELTVINIAGKTLGRSIATRIMRFPAAARGWINLLLASGLRGATLYLSVSGGLGQLYDMLFVVLARIRGMHIILHHHSFAYLDKPNFLARVFLMSAGSNACHITQSVGMAARLRENYSSVIRVVPLSNAVFLVSQRAGNRPEKNELRTLGFISNISSEKGVFEFLDLVAAYEEKGLELAAKLAGPFQDSEIERTVCGRIAELSTVEYVGPKYGEEKNAFFEAVDALIFPTKYDNETEGIVNHEAMCRGIPVIAYGRGCIREIVSGESGLVIDPSEKFTQLALSKITNWVEFPEIYRIASRAAAEKFAMTVDESSQRWKELLEEILRDSSNVS